MMQARAADILDTGLLRPLSRFAKTPFGGVILACVSVALAILIREALEIFGQFYYLPMVPAVMITALFANRFAILLSVVLSVAANLLMVQRADTIDALANAILFILVALMIAAVCRRLIAAISAARTLSRNLAGREALLDAILASVPVATLDRDGRVRRVTHAAADLLGAEVDEILGRPFRLFVPDFNMDAVTLSAERHQTLEPPPAGHWTARNAQGASVPLAIHADALPDHIDPEHVVLSLADQRPAQAVRERERDLAEQLSNVWRLNSMGEMAATLAHELNQPLTAATVYLHAGQTDIARVGPVGDSAGRAIDLAKTQLLRAGEIIRRMRDLIVSGARSFSEESAAAMIDDLAPVFALISRDSGVTINVDMDEHDDHVLADRIQIQQAVANLVRNGVDAVMGRDDAQVSVTGRLLAGAGYEILVEDNGPGIPDAQRDDMFRPMTTTKAGGMGLGLSVTRSIVESHGATLVVGRSTLGGASFSFRLSRVTELEAA